MIKLLEGMRVVELASFMMGPIAGRILGEWGADVVKVEPAIKITMNPSEGDGDRMRGTGMSRGIVNGDPCCFQFVNGNKKSVCIDSFTPAGKQAMVDLCLSADVVISHLRPKDAKKLGVDYKSLSAKNPGIIVASTSGYGTKGPDGSRPGFDAVAFTARSGMINGLSPSGEPYIPFFGMGDVTSGTYLALSILAAYVNKLKTGKGDNVTTSLYGSAIWTAGLPIMTSRYGDPYPTPRMAVFPTNKPFRCADGKWLYVMANIWESAIVDLCKIMDMPADAKTRWPHYFQAAASKAEITEILDREFAKHDRDYWIKKLSGTSIPFDVVADFKDVQEDPQAWEAGYLTKNVVDGYEVGIPTAPGQFDNAGEPELFMSYPGEHTVEQLKKIGYSDEKIESLLGKGVVTQHDPATYEYDRFNIMKEGTTYNKVMGGKGMM